MAAVSGSVRDRLAGVEFLTVAEVAEITRVSKMTVYRLIHDGELDATKLGKRMFRVRADAVASWMGLDDDPAVRP